MIKYKFIALVALLSLGSLHIASAQNNLDAGIVQMNSPLAPHTGATKAIQIRLRNFGNVAITKVKVAWWLNGIAQSDITANVSIAVSSNANQIPTGNLNLSTSYVDNNASASFQFVIKEVNDQTDASASNDTLRVNFGPALSGNRVIGIAPADYRNFTQAVDAIRYNGVGGNVVFKVKSGTYADKIDLVGTEIHYDVANSSITFESQSGKRDVILVSESGLQSTVRLNGADRITVQNFRIVNRNIVSGIGVQIFSGADRNVINNCEVTVDSISNTAAFAGILMAGMGGAPTFSLTTTAAGKFNTISNNKISGGYYGIAQNGAATPRDSALVIDNNNISQVVFVGIAVNNSTNAKIRKNKVDFRSSASLRSSGISLQNISTVPPGNIEIAQNYVANAGQLGLVLSAVNGTGNPTNRYVNIYNNMIAGGFVSNSITAGEIPRGIQIQNSGWLNVYFNSVFMDGPQRPSTVDNTMAFFINGATTTGLVRVFNNNFVNDNKGYAYYNASASATNPVTLSNNNNLFVRQLDTLNNPTTGFAFWNGAIRTNLRDLIAGGGRDQSSISKNPNFFSKYDLHTLATDLNQRGSTIPLTECPIDYDGELRDQVNPPDIGCDEFGPGGEDFAVIGITPDVFRFNKPTPWNITVRYQGSTSGNKKLFFLYKIDGVDQLDPDSAIEFQFTQLNSYFRSQTFTVPAKFHITRPNYQPFKMTVYIFQGNIGDLRPINDSIVMDICVGLEGVFTIDPTSAPSVTNFTSFTEIYDYLKCGVAGPTEFRIQDGIYDEQINLWKIRNSSAINTITFRAKSNPLATRLTYINGTAENHATVLFNGAQHIILRELTIENRSLANGSCIQLAGNSKNNRITDCFIRVDSTITPFPTSLVPIVSSKLGTLLTAPFAINSQDNIIERNTIAGGFYAVAMFGQDTAQRDKGNIIQDNKIVSFHKAGVYLEFADTKVLHNVITGKFGMDANAWGIFASRLGEREGVDENLISGNRIYDITFQGIVLQNCMGKKNPGAKKSTFVVSNNSIGGGFTTIGTSTTGLLITNSRGISILHNSILMDAPRTSSTTASESVARCAIIGDTNTGIEAFNNIFYSTGGAIALEYYARLRNQGSANTGLSAADNNLYFTTYQSRTTPLILIMRRSNLNVTKKNYQFSQLSQSSQNALTEFKNDQNNSTRERKSIGLPVKFERLPYDLHSYDLTIESKAIGGIDVATDFDKEPRKSRNTDIGADEFTVPNYDLDVYQVLNPLLCYTKPNKVVVQLRNRGRYSLEGTSVVLEYQMSDGDGGFNFVSADTVKLRMKNTGDLQEYTFKNLVSVPSKGFYTLCVRLKSGLNQDTVYTNNQKCKDLCTGIEGQFYVGFDTVFNFQTDTARYFSAIQEAANFVSQNCGICDETFFNINPGKSPYIERVLFPKYLVNLDSPLVTFRPYNTTLNTAVEIRQPASPAGDADKLHYTVRLFGANFVRLQNLTISNTGAAFGSGVHFSRNALNNIVEGCKIQVNSTSANGVFYPIAFTSTNKLNINDLNSFAKNGSNNRIVRNELIGGFASIALLGASVVDFDFGNVIDSNILRDFFQFGVYTANNTAKSISFNELTPRATSAATCVSISYNFAGEGGLINANKIINSKQIGIKVYGVDAFVDNRLVISNNWITNNFGLSTADTASGILIKRSNNVGIYYNSIRYNGLVGALSIQRDSAVVNTPEGPSKVYFTPFNIHVRNNIIMTDSVVGTRKPYVLFFNSTDPTSEFDNNNHFSGYPSRFAFYPPNNQNTFAIWRQNTAKDLNSFNLRPLFVSGLDLNLRPGDTLQFDKKARPISSVKRDFYNRKRSPRVTDIGSVEYEKENWNVSLLNVVNKKAVFGSNTFSVTILNEGNQDLTTKSVCLQYSIDSGQTWSASETVTLNQLKGRYDEQVYNFNIKYNKRDYLVIPLCVRIVPTCRLANDTILEFETVCKDLCVGLGKGDYTIGKNGTEDFATFQEAVVALICGFDSSIVFKVSPGTYRERFSIPAIQTNFDTTVKFVSKTGNAKDVIIQYENTAEDIEHHVIQLDGTKHITFSKLTIKSNARARASGIHIADTAAYNTVEGCIFEFDSTAIANTLVGVLGSGKIAYTELANNHNNTVRNCTFLGGAFGVRFLNDKAGLYTGANQVINSTFRGQLTAGIDLFYSQTDSLSGNNIMMRKGNPNSVGINLYGALTDFIILNNTIVRAQNAGLVVDSCRTVSRGLIANNMIAGGFSSDGKNGDAALIIKNTGAFPSKGINSSGTIDVVYNSVLYDGESDTASAFKVDRSNSLNVFNNIFCNYGKGYAIHFISDPSSVTEFVEVNANLLFAEGLNLGSWKDSICKDLVELGIQDQGNGPFNIGSSPKGLGEFDPLFRSNFDLHVNNTRLDGAAIPYDVVAKDIDGQVRNPSTPDVGCDEYLPGFDAQLNAFITPTSNATFQDSVAVIVQVKNVGADLNLLKVKYTFDGQFVDSSVKIFNPALRIDSVSTITFAKKFSTRQGGPHTLCAYTEIKRLDQTGKLVNNDFNTANDTICINLISLDTVDIGVSKFLTPFNGVPINSKTPVSVEVTNYGNLSAYNYTVQLKVGNKVKERKTINEPLHANESVDVSFNYQIDPDSAVTFEICAQTFTGDDVILANDSNCIVIPTVGIDMQNAGAGLLNVFPNPTVGNVNYELELQQESEIDIEVYDLAGRLIQKEYTGFLPAGRQIVRMNYDGIAEGTYLFVLRVGKQSVNGRFVILK